MMGLARPLHIGSWLVAVVAIAFGTALIWLGPPNLIQSQNPSTPAFSSLADIEAAIQAARQVGQPIADFELADLDGNAVQFSSLSGRPVVINYWATWCAPCRAEMSLLQAFYEEQKQSGLVVLGIDAGEPVGAVRRFLDEQGITYPVWVDPPGTEPSGSATLSLFTTLGGIGLPTTYFVDTAGRIAETHLGEIDRPTLEAKADRLLESSSSSPTTSQSD
jgi:peroxiredoxin